MSDLPGGRPRPGPRPRPSTRPSPRPRVAGSRRDRDATDPAEARGTETAAASGPAVDDVVTDDVVTDDVVTDDVVTDDVVTDGETSEDAADDDAPAGSPSAARERAGGSAAPTARRRSAGRGSTSTSAGKTASQPASKPTEPGVASAARSRDAAGRRRRSPLVAVLALLCVLAAAGAGWLIWERLDPRYVDESVLAATEAGVQALYAYDYRDSEGSVQRKLDVLTGELREQYENDLAQGGIIQTYEQVSATTSYEVLEVGLQRINDAQDTATLVVFGQYVVKSVNTGEQAAPEGSECQVTPDGAQSCTQTVQVSVVLVDGEWKIDELTLLTTS